MSQVLQVADISQDYPGVRALKNVSLGIEAGEVLGLVGENGAGKSTLIRVIGGIESPTQGTVSVHGQPQSFRSSADSQAAGISVVSQEFRQVAELSVADNVFLGHEVTRGGVVNLAETRQQTQAVLDELDLDLDPNRPVSSLTVGDRQMVEIARALSRNFDVLIMDEPTAALNGAEIKRLHQIVRRLAKQGKAIIYVSHHLEEIFDICDNVAVLRDGALVAHAPTVELDEARLVEEMLGRKPESYERGDEAAESTSVALEVNDVQVPGVPEPFKLTVNAGEILGLAGLVGSGRTELTRALFGDLPIFSGEIVVDGEKVRLGGSRQMIRQGVFMLSEDRKNEGILPHLDVTENSMLSRDRSALPLWRRLLPVPSEERTQFEQLREEMSIRVPHGRQLIGNLSGGNQQKVLLGRAFLSGCKVLLLNEPTRGVDVGAKVDIYQLIRRLADSGVAVIVSSADAPEIAAIADRCLVYFTGRQVAELVGPAVTEENIVGASVGQSAEGNAHV